MSGLLIDDLNTAWNSSNAAVFPTATTTEMDLVRSRTSNRFAVLPGALNEFAELLPAAPLDLSEFDELRFWVRASRRASGTPRHPFFLEFSYTDTNDLPAEEHRWFVPVNQPGRWEQRRIGIETDRRSSIDAFRFRSLTDQAFVADVDTLIAVHDEMLPDLEAALRGALEEDLTLGAAVDFAQAASSGDNQIELVTTELFSAGNEILLQGGDAGNEIHRVSGVAQLAGSTQLTLAGVLAGNYLAAGSTASLLIPIVFEAPPQPADLPTPVILVNHLDLREDLERTGFYLQRDSFRPRGEFTEVSTRPAARAYHAEYQIVALAPLREQQSRLHEHITRRISAAQGLLIHDRPAPVAILAPPPLRRQRVTGQIAPVYVQIGVAMETHPREAHNWVRTARADAAQIGAPADQEGIVITV